MSNTSGDDMFATSEYVSAPEQKPVQQKPVPKSESLGSAKQQYLVAKQRLIGACAGGALAFVGGIVLGIFGAISLWPQHQMAPPEPRRAPEKPEAPKRYSEEEMKAHAKDLAEKMAFGLAEKLVTTRLEENWLGLLEIEDGQTTRAPHRQAGVQSKVGIIGLPKDTLLKAHGYVVENKVGIGLASTVIEGNRYYVSFHWLPGAAGPPTQLKEFRVVQGKKIEVVSAK